MSFSILIGFEKTAKGKIITDQETILNSITSIKETSDSLCETLGLK